MGYRNDWKVKNFMPGDPDIARKNFRTATEIRQQGFKTKIHASRYKDQIDDWLISARWSARQIINELNKLYPNQDHPSRKAIENYRRKYLPKEIRASRSYQTDALAVKLREEVLRDFEPAIEGIQQWKRLQAIVERMEAGSASSKTVNKNYIDLLKTVGQFWVELTNSLQKLGVFAKQYPQSDSPESSEYDPKEVRKAIKSVIAYERVSRIAATLNEPEIK